MSVELHTVKAAAPTSILLSEGCRHPARVQPALPVLHGVDQLRVQIAHVLQQPAELDVVTWGQSRNKAA